MTTSLRLTEKRLRILKAASEHHLGLVDRPYHTGFERVAWDKNASVLVEAGLLQRYVHGGYEITDDGREAYAQAAADDASAAPPRP